MDHEEEPHWKLSQVFLQYYAADAIYNNNLGMAFKITVQVSLVKTCLSLETYDVYNVHTGKGQEAMDHASLANH